jgi:rubrerythrin
MPINREELDNLLYEALETEEGGVKVYETALGAAVNEDLRQEWEEYLEQTRRHVQIVRELFDSLGLDPSQETPGRKVVRTIGEALVEAMELAQKSAPPEAAQIVAAECVVLAETKDHLNWSLLGQLAKELEGDAAEAIATAVEEVEDEEDEHLYHSQGWARELWLDNLGLAAELPPVEETEDVESEEEAVKARKKAKKRKQAKARR